MANEADQKKDMLRMRFDEPDRGDRTDVAARRQPNTVNTSRYKAARILFPALGFPAVIAPRGDAAGDTRDPSRCLTLLILSQRPLSKADVARHLRWVPWARRRTRWLPDAAHGGTNAFDEGEIDVRGNILSEDQGRLLPRYFGQDRHTQLYHVAGDHEGRRDGFGVGLSRDVRRFYWRRNYRHLNEVRIYESAAARLPAGLANLFWVNRDRGDDAQDRSAEMDLLLEEFAVPSRFGHDGIPALDKFTGKTREGQKRRFLDEYEYEFGQAASAETRVEVLHPVFVEPARQRLRIGHLTDLHIAVRHDVFQQKLAKAGVPRGKFHNWNRVCERLYANARASCDVLLMTGDLIDYGRGLRSPGSAINDDKSYLRDRNWFPFYAFLAGGSSYERPTYTTLGNHDWRINPYASLAPGAPEPETMKITKDELKQAHGPGADSKWYEKDSTNWTGGLKEKVVDGDGELDVGGTPLETTVDSVFWYLLLINPFLDYTMPLPGGYELVMLDWGEDEEVDRTVVSRGKDWGRTPLIPNTKGGPVAKNSLNEHQARLVEWVAKRPRGTKILGIHAPPLGPWPHWTDDDMADGKVTWEKGESPRGDTGARVIERDERGRERERHEHMAYALTTTYEPDGQEADYGTIGRRRGWLIRRMLSGDFAVVLSGHIHRQNVFALRESGVQNGAIYLRGVAPRDAASADTPLFVNTTSAGPRGSRYPRRGPAEWVESGWSEVSVSSAGKVEEVHFRTPADPPTPRQEPEITPELLKAARAF